MLSSFWQTVASLCAVSDQAWNDTMASFTSSHLLTPVAVDEYLIRSQVQAALDTHIRLARTTLSRDLLAIRRFIAGNQIVSALSINFYLRRPPTVPYQADVLKMSPRRFDNCSCLNIKGCPRSTGGNVNLNITVALGVESSAVITHLDASVRTRFGELTMQELLKELLIEQ